MLEILRLRIIIDLPCPEKYLYQVFLFLGFCFSSLSFFFICHAFFSSYKVIICVQDHPRSSQSSAGVDLSRSGSYDHAKQLASELPTKSYSSSDGESRYLLSLSLVYIISCFHCNHLYAFPKMAFPNMKALLQIFRILPLYRIQDTSVSDLHGSSGSTKEENQIVS